MYFANFIKRIGRVGDGLSEQDAHQLFGAMMDGGVPELELGAILLALRMRPETLPELLGFHGALNERVNRLQAPPGKAQPVVLPTYGGAREQPNLLPLLALLLQRFGVPVLMHGPLNGGGRVASAYILRELGVMPCASGAQAQQVLDEARIAFVPTAVLAPGLADLLSLRARLGVRSSAHALAKLMEPFAAESLRVVSASDQPCLDTMREFLLATGARALLLRGTDGEPFADPQRRPRLEYFQNSRAQVLFEAEMGPTKTGAALPQTIDAVTTAAWMKGVLAGETPVPLPLVNQLACCLFGSGYTHDMNQAKAIVAVETGSLAAA